MWYSRKAYFQTLKDVATAAGASNGWPDYAAYCTELERGLRRQAFAILDRFISQMELATFAERRRFVSWLQHRGDLRAGSHMLAPYPLQKRVIEPTLAEWLQAEPTASEPRRWLGGYEHLKHAIQLDRHDEIAHRRFINFILGHVDYATHELPYGYLGEPDADLELLAEAEAALAGLSSDDDRKRAGAEITEQRRLIQDYLRTR